MRLQPVARGFQGIWYCNQPQGAPYHYKYSGGFATYPQQHMPLAVYSPQVQKTFFCYGGRGETGTEIVNLVSYFDHASGKVARPTILLQRKTFDAHYNPTLGLDPAGFLYLMANSHGVGGEMQADDPTYGKSYIFRSQRPYDTEKFAITREDNFSYSQLWPVPGQGLCWLHTRYQDWQRRLFYAVSRDGLAWSEPRPLVHIGAGSYQISGAWRDRVATAFDYHPQDGGLNARTNLYYLETRDFGASWQTVDGKKVRLPLDQINNEALVHEYEKEGLLVYLKDLQFDGEGHPILLYLTSRGAWAGPEHGPRTWRTARWTGRDWERREITRSSHNYDHGSLYLESDGTWRLIAPLLEGPQAHGTGGEIAVMVSRDRGNTWSPPIAMTQGSRYNHTYVRRPCPAHPDFYAFWADGDAFAPSPSHLYFSTQAGRIFRLPPTVNEDFVRPEPWAAGTKT